MIGKDWEMDSKGPNVEYKVQTTSKIISKDGSKRLSDRDPAEAHTASLKSSGVPVTVQAQVQGDSFVYSYLYIGAPGRLDCHLE